MMMSRRVSPAKSPWLTAMILACAVGSSAMKVSGGSTHCGEFGALPEASRTSKVPDAATRAKVLTAYGNLPMSFEVNQGQTDERVNFLSRGGGYKLFLTATEAALVECKPTEKAEGPWQQTGGRDRRGRSCGPGGLADAASWRQPEPAGCRDRGVACQEPLLHRQRSREVADECSHVHQS